MIKIAHFGDVHIRNFERQEEYKEVFNKIYLEVSKIKPDRIAIVGDLFESFIEISNEAKIMAGDFINSLSKYSKVIITRGNHDIRKKNLNRIDSIRTIVDLIDNKNVVYYDKTGFYKDGKITWVVYDHPDKLNDPWLGKKKSPGEIYIGLFHDPIEGSKNDVGYEFKDSYKSISYFKKNDYVLLADIHKRQYFRKNKSAAYCGSTIQQSHGETVKSHGFLLWEIVDNKDFKVIEYDIKNEYRFIDLYLDGIIDYDNLKLENIDTTSKSKIKIHWTDYSSNINTENEKKIRDYISNKYKISKIKFNKTQIYTDVLSSKMLSETIDLTNLETQKDIFKEYLKELKYKKSDIDKILSIDHIINERLEITKKQNNIEWDIEKIWFNNFKSYGDNNEIPLKNVDGIIQINGKNQQGKTTILDAISYVLYGKTSTTEKRQKNGDNRYINNKRKIDKCSGGATLNINGEKININRETFREWNKSKNKITKCSTIFDYYKSEIIIEKNKLTGEQRKDTQKLIDEVLGDFKDFIRLSFTNAENLNDLLSNDRSVFIDSIIKDAGYDIFEKKLKEYKEYRKEQKEERYVVDVEQYNSTIDTFKKEIKLKESKIFQQESLILEYDNSLDKNNIERDNFIKKMYKINEDLETFNPDITKESIDNYEKNISKTEIEIAILEKDIKELPLEFDNENLSSFKLKLKESNKEVIRVKDEISKISKLNLETNNKIDKVKMKIIELISNEKQKLKEEISSKEIEISKIESEKKAIINKKINELLNNINEEKLTLSSLQNRIKEKQKDGISLKKENDEIEEEIKDIKNSKTCPTCGREYGEGIDHSHINNKIKDLEDEISDNLLSINELISEYKEFKLKISPVENNIKHLTEKINKLKNNDLDESILNEINNIESTTVDENINELNLILVDIENNIFIGKLKETMDKGKSIVIKYKENKDENLIVIHNLEDELKGFNIDNIENDISIEEKKKVKFEERKEKINIKEKYLLNNENYNLKINELNLILKKYNDNLEHIEKNKEYQFSINRINEHISILKENIKECNGEISDENRDIAIRGKEIEMMEEKINKFLNQKKRDELYKEYERCISRDGIPTYLLKKSIHLINSELSDLLSNVDFTLFFNDNLILKMSADDRLDVTQNAIESSGKERTFCSLALKIALRQINIKSKPNLIILDEVMGKLIDESIPEFIDFLDLIKTKVKKILIIEHNHPINFDGLIEVKKDDNLISSLKVNF